MEQQDCFIKYIEQSIIRNWNRNALTDYNEQTLQYKDVAQRIAEMHLLFEECSITPGDKVAICGKNSSSWCVAFLAAITYGAVPVPILHEFKADSIHNIINHSEARIFYVENHVWKNLCKENMPQLEGVVLLNTMNLIVSRSEKLSYTQKNLTELIKKRYPLGIRPQNILYRKDKPEELALINYTSGTTGFSKGVMLPYRSLTSNIEFYNKLHSISAGNNIIARLPFGHVFGMAYDFLYTIFNGAHIHFLTQTPTPESIAQAFQDIKPKIAACVPIIVERIFRSYILPEITFKGNTPLTQTTVIDEKLKASLTQKVMNEFGGECSELIIGGAPLNREIENAMKAIRLPYSIGYGMTECGPSIAHNSWKDQKLGTCGKVADNMEIRILSPDPENIPGELLCRGTNLMLGYYKDEEATRTAIDRDGWLHTGDMAVMSKEGYVSLRGRCKNILINSSGHNIYPEEIESILNNMPYVMESIIIMQNEKLVALIHPDFETAFINGLSKEDIESIMESNCVSLNKLLPGYSQITKMKLFNDGFEKTAKNSIKRYLYQDLFLLP